MPLSVGLGWAWAHSSALLSNPYSLVTTLSWTLLSREGEARSLRSPLPRLEEPIRSLARPGSTCWLSSQVPIREELWLSALASRGPARVCGSWRVRLGAQDTQFSCSSRSSSLETPEYLARLQWFLLCGGGGGNGGGGLDSDCAWPPSRLGAPGCPGFGERPGRGDRPSLPLFTSPDPGTKWPALKELVRTLLDHLGLPQRKRICQCHL